MVRIRPDALFRSLHSVRARVRLGQEEVFFSPPRTRECPAARIFIAETAVKKDARLSRENADVLDSFFGMQLDRCRPLRTRARPGQWARPWGRSTAKPRPRHAAGDVTARNKRARISFFFYRVEVLSANLCCVKQLVTTLSFKTIFNFFKSMKRRISLVFQNLSKFFLSDKKNSTKFNCFFKRK